MSPSFEFTVTTVLPVDAVWEIFSEVSNWPKIGDVYESVRWIGEPWEHGSRLRAQVHEPDPLEFLYIIKSCKPASEVRYIAQGEVLGFALERTTTFEAVANGTRIRTQAFCVGSSVRPLKSGSLGFMRDFTTRWYEQLAHYCDLQAVQAAVGTQESACRQTRPRIRRPRSRRAFSASAGE